MGQDLYGVGGYFRFNWIGWRQALALAWNSAWKPAGTEPNEEYIRMRYECADPPVEVDEAVARHVAEWDGNYLMNAFQRVTADDARRLADALERALPDVPHHDAMAPYKPRAMVLQSMQEVADILTGKRQATTANPYEWFSGGQGRQKLADFIRYCRAGTFEIH